MMEIIIHSYDKQADALLYIKKFKSVMGFNPISKIEDGRYVISINAEDKPKYTAAKNAGRL